MRNNIFLSVAISLVITVSQALAGPADPVNFNDANLKAAIEAELGVTDPTESDMLGLENLIAENLGIEYLTGLEYAKNLQHLELAGNQISDLSPLSGLTNLKELVLSHNQIADIRTDKSGGAGTGRQSSQRHRCAIRANESDGFRTTAQSCQ